MPGDKYVVVDSGGGTVDLTVHQIRLPEGHLKELYKATGEPPPGWLASPASSRFLFTHFKSDCGWWRTLPSVYSWKARSTKCSFKDKPPLEFGHQVVKLAVTEVLPGFTCCLLSPLIEIQGQSSTARPRSPKYRTYLSIWEGKSAESMSSTDEVMSSTDEVMSSTDCTGLTKSCWSSRPHLWLSQMEDYDF